MTLALRLEAFGNFDLAEVSGLLNTVWAAPAIHYSGAYLDWQLRFPQGGGRCACLRDGEGRLQGFGGYTRRRLRVGDLIENFAVVTFFGVANSAQGQGWGRRLYEELLPNVPSPVLTFARSGSIGARLIERVYPAIGFQLLRLQDCPSYASMTARATIPEGWRLVAEEPEASESAACVGAGVLLSCPDKDEARHWSMDPRRRERRRLEGPTGWAAADVLRQSVRQANGQIAESVTLERVWVEGSWGDGLSALVSSLRGETDIVQAANLSIVPEEDLRKSGWRKIGSGFQSWIACRQGDRFSHALTVALSSNADIV